MRYGVCTKVVALVVFTIGFHPSTIHPSIDNGSAALAAEAWRGNDGALGESDHLNATAIRMREGTRIATTTGTFARLGRRWVFEFDATSQVDSGETKTTAPSTRPTQPLRLRVLENLSLQRIVEATTQDATDHRWKITGLVTEFGDENWLLLTTAIRATKSADGDGDAR